MDRRATRRNVPSAAAAGTVIPNDGRRRDLLLQKSDNAASEYSKEDTKIRKQEVTKIPKETSKIKGRDKARRATTTIITRCLTVVAILVALQLLYFVHVNSQDQQNHVSVGIFFLVDSVCHSFANRRNDFCRSNSVS